ncbi:MAG: ABC transporter ATP-binding protein [Aestuariivirgaceae bacterium]
MLSVSDLTRAGLGPISFTVDDGGCLAVTGPSGAGKTLLLRAIADLDPNNGVVHAGDRERREVPAPQWRRQVGFVPAESGWWADNVGDHFAEPDLAKPIIDQLGLPQEALDWQVARLSTGERHRLALARTLALKPDILLLDEPTAALDKDATAKAEEIIRTQMEHGVSIVLVTHEAGQVRRMADAVLTIKDGRAGAPEPVK